MPERVKESKYLYRGVEHNLFLLWCLDNDRNYAEMIKVSCDPIIYLNQLVSRNCYVNDIPYV